MKLQYPIFFSLVFVLLVVTAFSQSSAHLGAAKFAPEDGKKLLIIGQDLGAVGGLSSHNNGYIDNIQGHVPAGVTSYTDIPNFRGLKTQANWGAGDVNANAYVNSEYFEQSFIVIGLYMVDRLDGINDGFYDNSIRNFADWVKGQNRPIFIRIGYEFDGPWNNYNATAFKNAWRRIVHIFDEEQVRNAAYVWQSAGINNGNINNWYPGDEYVNWCAFSYFENHNSGQKMEEFAAAKSKPIMIAESTPRIDLKQGNGETNWRNWFAKVFQRIYDNDDIKAFAYINVNWDIQSLWNGQGWGDSRVEVNEFIKNTWENEIRKDPWITSSDSLFQILELEKWQSNTTTPTVDIDDQDHIRVAQNAHQLNIWSIDKVDIDKVQIWNTEGKLLINQSFKAAEIFIQPKINSLTPIIIRIFQGTKIYQKIHIWHR